MTGAVAFVVGLAGDVLVEAAHEPAHRGETLTPGLGQVFELLLLDRKQSLFSQIALRQDCAAEQRAPTLDHLARRPGLGQREVYMQNRMDAITE